MPQEEEHLFISCSEEDITRYEIDSRYPTIQYRTGMYRLDLDSSCRVSMSLEYFTKLINVLRIREME